MTDLAVAIRSEIQTWTQTRFPKGCRVGSAQWVDGLTRRVMAAIEAETSDLTKMVGEVRTLVAEVLGENDLEIERLRRILGGIAYAIDHATSEDDGAHTVTAAGRVIDGEAGDVLFRLFAAIRDVAHAGLEERGPTCDEPALTPKGSSTEAGAVGQREAGPYPWSFDDGTEFEVWDDVTMVASACGSRERAWQEAMHYAMVYGQDGPVYICEAIRVPMLFPAPSDGAGHGTASTTDRSEIPGILETQPSPSKSASLLSGCAADRDGDCRHQQCPQLRDGEPGATGRHCPLDGEGE